MSDTEILNTLQALLEEHFKGGGLGMDFTLGAMSFTIHRPHAMSDCGAPDLRGLFAAAMERHTIRLVTNKLMEAGRAA